MQRCPSCGTNSRVFFNFLTQASHNWYCLRCHAPLRFDSNKGAHGLVVILLTTMLLYVAITEFDVHASAMLVVGLPVIVLLDYVRYVTVNYVERDLDRESERSF